MLNLPPLSKQYPPPPVLRLVASGRRGLPVAAGRGTPSGASESGGNEMISGEFDVVVVGCGQCRHVRGAGGARRGRAGVGAGGGAVRRARRQQPLHRGRFALCLQRRRRPPQALRPQRDRDCHQRFRHLHDRQILRRPRPADRLPQQSRYGRAADHQEPGNARCGCAARAFALRRCIRARPSSTTGSSCFGAGWRSKPGAAGRGSSRGCSRPPRSARSRSPTRRGARH